MVISVNPARLKQTKLSVLILEIGFIWKDYAFCSWRKMINFPQKKMVNEAFVPWVNVPFSDKCLKLSIQFNSILYYCICCSFVEQGLQFMYTVCLKGWRVGLESGVVRTLTSLKWFSVIFISHCSPPPIVPQVWSLPGEIKLDFRVARVSLHTCFTFVHTSCLTTVSVFKLPVVNHHYWPCQGGAPIFTFALCMFLAYFN